jgi:outer membrane protein TolC
MKKIKIFFTSCFLLSSAIATAQTNSLRLDSCQYMAKENYPLIKQHQLIEKTNEYTIANISKGFLPQINIAGQATYQSEVTQFPKAIPGVTVLTKDQYKIYADINQPIYDGGVIQQQKKLQEATSVIDQQKLEVELYKLRDRINNLFFGVLLVQAQQKQNELMKNDIQLGLNKIEAAIPNGTALKSSADVLKAQLLQTNQQTLELQANRKAFADMLGFFINRQINENTVFEKPQNIIPSQEIRRPELQMFDYQNKIFDAQNNLLTARNRPKVSFFVQGGFGKPAFNILSNNFDPFYIGGLRFNFPISGFYTLKNDRALINLNRENVSIQKETFLFNTNVALQQQNEDIVKLKKILKTDEEIIPLRTHIKETALAQLNYGVINSSDYLREVNAENTSRQNKILHQIQLLVAEYNQRNTVGE